MRFHYIPAGQQSFAQLAAHLPTTMLPLGLPQEPLQQLGLQGGEGRGLGQLPHPVPVPSAACSSAWCLTSLSQMLL